MQRHQSETLTRFLTCTVTGWLNASSVSCFCLKCCTLASDVHAGFFPEKKCVAHFENSNAQPDFILALPASESLLCLLQCSSEAPRALFIKKGRTLKREKSGKVFLSEGHVSLEVPSSEGSGNSLSIFLKAEGARFLVNKKGERLSVLAEAYNKISHNLIYWKSRPQGAKCPTPTSQ